jgi:hypothetical protein
MSATVIKFLIFIEKMSIAKFCRHFRRLAVAIPRVGHSESEIVGLCAFSVGRFSERNFVSGRRPSDACHHRCPKPDAAAKRCKPHPRLCESSVWQWAGLFGASAAANAFAFPAVTNATKHNTPRTNVTRLKTSLIFRSYAFSISCRCGASAGRSVRVSLLFVAGCRLSGQRQDQEGCALGAI